MTRKAMDYGCARDVWSVAIVPYIIHVLTGLRSGAIILCRPSPKLSNPHIDSFTLSMVHRCLEREHLRRRIYTDQHSRYLNHLHKLILRLVPLPSNSHRPLGRLSHHPAKFVHRNCAQPVLPLPISPLIRAVVSPTQMLGRVGYWQLEDWVARYASMAVRRVLWYYARWMRKCTFYASSPACLARPEDVCTRHALSSKEMHTLLPDASCSRATCGLMRDGRVCAHFYASKFICLPSVPRTWRLYATRILEHRVTRAIVS